MNKDVTLTDNEPKELLLEKHKQYIALYDTNKDEYVRLFIYFQEGH